MSSHTHRYPYDYSYRVVQAFLDSYGRAAIFIGKKLGMSPAEMRDSLVICFAHRPARWNALRDTIKVVEKQDLYAAMRRMTKAECIDYLTAVRSLVDDDMLDRAEMRNSLLTDGSNSDTV